jgi:hypothetical protein
VRQPLCDKKLISRPTTPIEITAVPLRPTSIRLGPQRLDQEVST